MGKKVDDSHSYFYFHQIEIIEIIEITVQKTCSAIFEKAFLNSLKSFGTGKKNKNGFKSSYKTEQCAGEKMTDYSTRIAKLQKAWRKQYINRWIDSIKNTADIATNVMNVSAEERADAYYSAWESIDRYFDYLEQNKIDLDNSYLAYWLRTSEFHYCLDTIPRYLHR